MRSASSMTACTISRRNSARKSTARRSCRRRSELTGAHGADSLCPVIDIGANLTNKSFQSDLDVVLVRAREAGVTQIVVTGTSITESRAALALATTQPGRL